jgi:hypothetical protein
MAAKTTPCGTTDHTPRRPDNRAGLDQIAYRIATQPESLVRMLWKMPRQKVVDPANGDELYPLRALRTHDLADPTVSLIDAYAMATDVLSFYSERVANEGYIATATRRRSVLELARMIGYELSPGVAASAHLAFTVDTVGDPYRIVEVDVGVQAMSIPARKDQLPQIFETVEAMTARAEWNEIHARTERPQNLVLYNNAGNADDDRNGSLFIFDLDGSFDTAALADPDLVTIAAESELAPYHPLAKRIDLPAALANRIADSAANDQIEPVLHALPVDEVCLRGLGLNLRPGTRMLAVGQAGEGDVTAQQMRVVSASEDKAFGITRVVLTESGTAPKAVRRAPFFTFARLLAGRMPDRKIALDSHAVSTYVRGARWTGDGLTALVQSQAWQRTKVMALIAKILLPEPDDDDVELGLHVMRDNSGFFGATAPLWATLDYGEGSKGPYDNHDWDSGPNTIWTNAVGTLLTGKAQAFLDREIKDIQPNSWAILESSAGASLGLRVVHAAPESRADYAITGKSMGIGFETAAGGAVQPGDGQGASIYNNFRFRSTQIYAVSHYLPMSGVPLSPDMPEAMASVELDGLYLDLERGRPVALSGARLDAEGLTGRETHIISEVHHIDGVTRLFLESATAFPYERVSVRLNANVALATHGEHVEEELGSGDGRLTHQQFKLKKPPLSFVSAANEAGRASTLEIRVDGVLWAEVPALGQAGPEDSVYEVRQTDDGTTWIRFGDGVTGRRLPTGELNVRAVYRSGIGLGGEVSEEAIAQFKKKPLGIRSVVNPSPATGAADPETLDGARVNAPAAVKTLGRIVSLTDYEDFARQFAGIGKAQVRELWSGQDKVAHLTVAPEADAELVASDTVIVNLVKAIEKARDPSRPVIAQPYVRRLFTMTACIDVDPAYLQADVELAVRKELESRFGYDARMLAQPVSAAQVIAALHAVPGVVSADLDALAVLLDGDVVGTPGISLEEVLPAYPALGPGQRGTGPEFTPAELLTVLPSAIILTTREAHDA